MNNRIPYRSQPTFIGGALTREILKRPCKNLNACGKLGHGVVPNSLFLLATETVLRIAAVDRGVRLSTGQYRCRYGGGVMTVTPLEGP